MSMGFWTVITFLSYMFLSVYDAKAKRSLSIDWYFYYSVITVICGFLVIPCLSFWVWG